MAGLMQNLTDHLTAQLIDFDALIVLSEAKTEHIVSNNYEELSKITSAESTLVGKMQKNEKIREELMREIAIVLNITDTSYTLTYLAEMIKEQEEYELLIKLAEQTRERMERLRALNLHNKELVESSLDYIDFSVNVIHSSYESDKRFYDAKDTEIADTTSFFDAMS